MFQPVELCHYWFHSFVEDADTLSDKTKMWFNVDKKRDMELRRRFMIYTVMASEHGLDDWLSLPKGWLAFILLTDRITRACYRHTTLAYSNDSYARQLCLQGLKRRMDAGLSPLERIFFYFPLLASMRTTDQIHAHDLLQQIASGDLSHEEKMLTENLQALVARNLLVLEKFHCFPHRKLALGAMLNAQEKAFVQEYEWQNWL